MPGPNPIAATGNQFPFGGFARNVDLLQVPFVGAYRITPFGQSPAQGFVEMNSVTMDSSLADDQVAARRRIHVQSSAVDFDRHRGPTRSSSNSAGFARSATHSQTSPRPPPRHSSTSDPNSQYWHYHWAKRLFDYVTVQAPHDDYFPNVDPHPRRHINLAKTAGKVSADGYRQR